tara:strand:- start:203 stop:1330 length:1128 start_codon:yes stop_codon:yes gene_type:complete
MKDLFRMVDLKNQYLDIKSEIDEKIQETIDSTQFIGGENVEVFKTSLQKYLGVNYVIPCANGTDALQISLMSLNLNRGDEIIVPAFTYISTAEVIGLLGLKPIIVDVDYFNFNISIEKLEGLITNKTKVIIPVHLFGQSSPMEDILLLSDKYNLFVIEDNAQSLGADFIFKDGKRQKLGTIGHIGCTSFFPSKNLGCFGDGGAIMTNNKELAVKLKTISNHGQSKKYHHDIIGCNSRLDSIQAAVLNVKLKYLDLYNQKRNKSAIFYNNQLKKIKEISIPNEVNYSTHVYHQYTLKIKQGKRDMLKLYLNEKNIQTMIYYPIPLHKQRAFKFGNNFSLPISEKLCKEVISLPMHTELDNSSQEYIIKSIKSFFKL